MDSINRQIVLVRRPAGMPDESCFKLGEVPVPELGEGQVLIRTRYISVDPYMRGRMKERKSYIPPFQLNAALNGGVVGEVAQTKSKKFSKGDFVTGFLPWQDYSSANEDVLRKLDPKGAPVSTALGVLGTTGLSAYFGLLDIGKPKRGETVVVSGAAGAVGMSVGQIAKIKGCRAVGIAGSEKKVKYLIDELGFDAAIDYKAVPDMGAAVGAACPTGVDIYFDNVGGTISDAVLAHITDNARIIICGQIDSYNMEDVPVGPRVELILLAHTALMKGFLVNQYAERFDEGRAQLAAWLKENKLKYVETIIEGLENAPKAFLGLFKGENLGKQIVKVG
jgi:NADPH:quinone reductase